MVSQMMAVQPQKRLMTPRHLNFLQLNIKWATLGSFCALLLTLLAFAPAQASQLTQQTITNSNLHLEPEQRINEDVFVFSGNVTMEEDSVISGDLFVMSGNIEIHEGAEVTGDVTAFSGNIEVTGSVDGDLTALSGNIELIDEAEVDGDVSVISGNFERGENTDIGGDIVSSRGFDFGKLFGLADSGIVDEALSGVGAEIRDEIESEIENEIANARAESEEIRAEFKDERVKIEEFDRERDGGGIGAVIGGIFGAIFMAFIMAAIAGLLALVRPSMIRSTQKRFKDELALCFGTGVVVNLGVFFLAGIIALTIVGLLVAIPAWTALFFLNILGSVVAVAALGERVADKMNLSAKYPVKIALGAAAIVLPLSLLWSMGGCFTVLGIMGFFVLNSIGVGALALPWVRRFMSDSDDVSTPYSGKARMGDDDLDDDDLDDDELDDDDLDDDDLDDDDLDDVIGAEPTDSIEEAAESTKFEAKKSDSEKPTSKTKPKKPVDGDDFTQIRGIGAVFAARLVDANVTSYAQLAAMTAEEIGEVFGWSADRVERDDITGQAQALADS